MHNDASYPQFSTVEELLSHPAHDPIGIRAQFDEFLAAENVAYPIILVRDDVFRDRNELERLEVMVAKLRADHQYDFSSLLVDDDQRSANDVALNSISNDTFRDDFFQRYLPLNKIFNSQPKLQLIMPAME